jgi:hypothetical protein
MLEIIGKYKGLITIFGAIFGATCGVILSEFIKINVSRKAESHKNIEKFKGQMERDLRGFIGNLNSFSSYLDKAYSDIAVMFKETSNIYKFIVQNFEFEKPLLINDDKSWFFSQMNDKNLSAAIHVWTERTRELIHIANIIKQTQDPKKEIIEIFQSKLSNFIVFCSSVVGPKIGLDSLALTFNVEIYKFDKELAQIRANQTQQELEARIKQYEASKIKK